MIDRAKCPVCGYWMLFDGYRITPHYRLKRSEPKACFDYDGSMVVARRQPFPGVHCEGSYVIPEHFIHYVKGG